MFLRRQPIWWWVWLCWCGLGLWFAARSWRATDLAVTSPHPGPECRPCLSGNGRLVAYEVIRPGTPFTDICLVDLETGENRRVGGQQNESSQQPRLDENGTTLAFSSFASDWVEGDDNSVSDIFLHDVSSGATQRLLPPRPLPGTSSSYQPSLSRDGRQVAFVSYGVPDPGTIRGRSLCLYTRNDGRMRALPDTFRARGPVMGPASFSPDGTRLAFSIFAVDMLPRAMATHYDVYMVSLHGENWPPALAPLPPRLTTNLAQRFWEIPELRELWKVALLSHQPDGGPANANSYQPLLLQDECIFASLADNLVSGDDNDCHDLFVRSLTTGRIQRLTAGNDSSFEPAVSRDGRWLAFTSYASDLVKGDDNGSSDVFLLDRQSGRLERLGPGHSPSISADGSRLAFVEAGRVQVVTRGGKAQVLP